MVLFLDLVQKSESQIEWHQNYFFDPSADQFLSLENGIEGRYQISSKYCIDWQKANQNYF